MLVKIAASVPARCLASRPGLTLAQRRDGTTPAIGEKASLLFQHRKIWADLPVKAHESEARCVGVERLLDQRQPLVPHLQRLPKLGRQKRQVQPVPGAEDDPVEILGTAIGERDAPSLDAIDPGEA